MSWSERVNRLGPLVAAVGAFALAGPGGAAAEDSETLLAGEISVAVIRIEQRGIEGNRSPIVRCNTATTRLELPFKPPLAIDVDQKTEQQLAGQLGLEDAERGSEAAVALRNALLAGAKRIQVDPLTPRAAEVVEVPKERCFNQTVVQQFRLVHYDAKPTWASGGTWKPDLRPFRWDERPEAQTIVEATYDPDCAAECAIPGKKRPVVGRDGKPLWAHVPVANDRNYLVPLFYDAKGSIIDIKRLLPPAARSVIAGEGMSPGYAVVARDHRP